MIDPRIANATSLVALLAAMREIEEECRETETDSETVYDIAALPTFGGQEPKNTIKIWSWDEQSLLVGDCIDTMQIVSRAKEAD